jgi:hypothetical protein
MYWMLTNPADNQVMGVAGCWWHSQLLGVGPQRPLLLDFL